MKLKPTVRFGSSDIAIAFAAIIANEVYHSNGVELVITSVNDSGHMQNSLHYKNCAFDMRTKSIPDEATKNRILSQLKESLTKDFDIVFESKGGDQEHIHLEYQPK